ncbi:MULTISPECIES: TetR/AcrR family transcriptional regulator [unclassified Bradyrhizobium]|uniref:TetR/AcrR family transcriptional regulator n=1 Tax=unclassified Bradyrhizobium TaxID=2631580 RepID=UPI0020B18C07|nr:MULTISPECIES: TetR/AcrR family transcriptional regulator [unclassified Bradyrhizobium]MCP3440715.1 TetR family transcriptional regulator [Bradyrhizobium sp. CCGUVB14]MCP3473414.1 TetR family transcriptional regulator [Bradyrhizobium sp. CCGUVB1N3]
MAEKPAIRDSIRTQEKILAAAQVEFARRGFDGARVDAIVERAKISKNLLYHYFRSKEDLYIRILERTYETLRRRQSDVSVNGLDPLNAMIRLCENTFRVFVEEPDVIVILNTENLHRAKHIVKSTIIRTMYDKLSENLREILQAGVQQGIFRQGVDPVELYISMSALGYFYLSNQHTLSILFKRKLGAPENIERRQAHLVDMVVSYLMRKPEPGDWTPSLARGS